jgi:hypothetical protein
MVSGFKAWCQTIYPNDNKISPAKTIYKYGLAGQNALTIANELYGNATCYLKRKHAKYIDMKTLYSLANRSSAPRSPAQPNTHDSEAREVLTS